MPEGTELEKTSSTELQAVLEESRSIQRRFMTVETTVIEHEKRLSLVEVAQSGLDRALEKLTEIMSVQATKTTLNESAIAAYRERTDLFADHMEKAIDRITDKQEGHGKEVASLKAQMNVVKAIGAALVGAGALVTVEHFFR